METSTGDRNECSRIRRMDESGRTIARTKKTKRFGTNGKVSRNGKQKSTRTIWIEFRIVVFENMLKMLYLKDIYKDKKSFIFQKIC